MKLLKNFLNLFGKDIKKKLEESMKGSEFIFDSVGALHYDLNKVSLSRDESYIDSPKWLKNKKATINSQNEKDDKGFQHALTVALSHKQIKKDPQRLSKVEPFIDQCSWKEINFPSQKESWKKFELNNKLIALNVLYVP